MTETIEVVAGVIERQDGHFLLASRPEGKPYAGYWEFPGGKIEQGEVAHKALARELYEELGIHDLVAYPWIHRKFSYPHANVNIHFYRIRSWSGTPSSLEGQNFCWCSPGNPPPEPMLPANYPVLSALALPSYYALTHFNDPADPLSINSFISALEKGVRLILMREPWINEAERIKLAKILKPLVLEKNASLLIHGTEGLAHAAGVDGIHFNSYELMRLDARPNFSICAASVHNADEISKAVELGLDFIMLSPVLRTKSHPEKEPIGWGSFASLVSECPIPVFALGGLAPGDLYAAMKAGSHGVAMQRAIWL